MALRLWRLGAYPLSNAEAEQSLAALALYRGGLPESGHIYSPLLLSLNALTFFLFGAGDAAPRLASVLLGSVLVFLPFTLRRHLGSPVCLLTSALLAISPAAVFLSRTLNHEIGAAVGGLMLVAGFFNWTESGRARWLWLMAGGLAILLTSGPMAYSILLIFGLMVLLKFSAFKALWANTPGTAAQGKASPQHAGDSAPPAIGEALPDSSPLDCCPPAPTPVPGPPLPRLRPPPSKCAKPASYL